MARIQTDNRSMSQVRYLEWNSVEGVGSASASGLSCSEQCMVHVCCVPGCLSRSDREGNLSTLVCPYVTRIPTLWNTKSKLVNGSTKVSSRHFQNATGRKLRPDEAPAVNLPKSVTPKASRSPTGARRLLPQLITACRC